MTPGRKLEWETVHEETGLHLTMHYQFYDGIPVVRQLDRGNQLRD